VPRPGRARYHCRLRRIEARGAGVERRDYSAEVIKHRWLTVRLAFAALGTLCVILALLGVFLPLLPTTPFLLLAAACYARASTRFYNWLLNHRVFGPLILEWRRYRSIPYRVKLWSIALMTVMLTFSTLFFVGDWRAQAALALLGAGLATWLYRIPSRDKP